MEHFIIICLLILHSYLLQLTNASRSGSCEAVYDLTNNINLFPTFIFPLPPNVDLSDRELFPSQDFKFTKAKLKICDGTVRYSLSGEGFPVLAPITVWQRHHDLSHPIFDYSLFVSPASRTTSRFNSGRYPTKEPNVFKVDEYGNFDWEIRLNYNSLKPFEVPLVNNIEPITQKSFCNIENMADYPNLCQRKYRESGAYTNIAIEFLREFDENGLQIVDNEGNAVIVRSPTFIDGLFIVVHIDLISHGITPGVFGDDNCIPNGFNCADRYVLAFIDLPTIQQIQYN